MTKKIFKQNILQNVQMDTQTSFMANGDINIYPCSWEDDKAPVTQTGKRIRYRGGIEVDEDGRTRVKRVREGSQGPHYRTLFETAHGSVQITTGTSTPSRSNVKVELKFPCRYGRSLTEALFREEAEKIDAFFKTRREEIVW